jgi:thiol-disulfide isomerase/thioredoxin
MTRRNSIIATLLLSLCTSVSIGFGQAKQDREDAWLADVVRGNRSAVLKETEKALADNPPATERAGILFVRARAQILEGDLAAAEQTIDAFRSLAAADERGAELLFRIAKATSDPAQRRQRFARGAERFPDTYWGKMSTGAICQLDSIGKPFELDFTDAITGRAVSLQQDYKGKIVVVLFWASWCPDCNAEMPQWKALYEKYRPRGVEFVGVSLDEPESAGGLESLKRYVASRQIPWPQFYQGNRFDSTFSQRWGVSATPTIFIVDASGNLAVTSAPADPEPAIIEHLARRDGSANRPG